MITAADPLTPGQPQLVPVLGNHRIDEAALGRYLSDKLDGFDRDFVVRQFQGGQSNPTYHVATNAGDYVLRKKPAGLLVASAHAVDREYAVMDALADTEVPVPKMLHLCQDESVIGQMFYVMEHVTGRVFTDRILPDCSNIERAAIYDDMNRVMAALHRVDYQAVGLGDFGRPDKYASRQIARWSRQYAASRLIDLPAMDRLIEWLESNIPAEDEAAIAHGDFRPGNLVLHPTEPRVVAVLDWELSTVGHPLADLAYNCLGYYLPRDGGRGFGDADILALGLPSEGDYLADYCARTGRHSIGDWQFFLILAMFRTIAIMVGVHARAVQGNAADANAATIARLYPVIADRAWALANRD
jgi:aminoglycoside phosphotransferase (APT) family kinase protein